MPAGNVGKEKKWGVGITLWEPASGGLEFHQGLASSHVLSKPGLSTVPLRMHSVDCKLRSQCLS